jgi:hypothetical protein
MHGRMGAFYAPCAGEGKHILQNKPFKSVDTIRGHTTEGCLQSLVSTGLIS